MIFQARLRSIDPTERRYREYELQSQPAADGGWVLTTRRGRIGSTLRPREDHFPTQAALVEEIARLLKRRTSHGYILAR